MPFFFFEEDENTFESIKHINEYGQEYWLARELQPVLEYTEWRNFSRIIDKAKEACSGSGNVIKDHFVDVNKMVEIGSSTYRELDESFISCYLLLNDLYILKGWRLCTYIKQKNNPAQARSPRGIFVLYCFIRVPLFLGVGRVVFLLLHGLQGALDLARINHAQERGVLQHAQTLVGNVIEHNAGLKCRRPVADGPVK